MVIGDLSLPCDDGCDDGSDASVFEGDACKGLDTIARLVTLVGTLVAMSPFVACFLLARLVGGSDRGALSIWLSHAVGMPGSTLSLSLSLSSFSSSTDEEGCCLAVNADFLNPFVFLVAGANAAADGSGMRSSGEASRSTAICSCGSAMGFFVVPLFLFDMVVGGLHRVLFSFSDKLSIASQGTLFMVMGIT